MSVRADAESLRRLPLFAECDPVHLQVIAFAAERQRFAPGDTLISEGGKGEAAYFILSGTVELRAGGTGPYAIGGEAEPGSLLGEVAMIGGMPYALTATAASEVMAARIDRALFLRVADAYPEFGTQVFKALARKLDHSVKDLTGVKGLLDQARSFSRRL